MIIIFWGCIFMIERINKNNIQITYIVLYRLYNLLRLYRITLNYTKI